MNHALGAGAEAGMFDPTGGGAWLDAVSNMLSNRAGAQQRAATMGARARNIDPSQLPLLASQAQIGADQGIADLLGGARVQQAQSVQDWLRDFANQQNQNLYGLEMENRGAQRQKEMQRRAARTKWLDALTSLAHSGATAYAGGG